MAFIFFLGTIRHFHIGWNWNRWCPHLSSANQPRPRCLQPILSSSTRARRSCSRSAVFCLWSCCRNILVSAKKFAIGCPRNGAKGISPTCGSIFLNLAPRKQAIRTVPQHQLLNPPQRPPEPNHELPNEIAVRCTAHHLCVRLGGRLR